MHTVHSVRGICEGCLDNCLDQTGNGILASLDMDSEAQFTRRPRGNGANTRDFELWVMKKRPHGSLLVLLVITCQPLHKIARGRRTGKRNYVKLIVS